MNTLSASAGYATRCLQNALVTHTPALYSTVPCYTAVCRRIHVKWIERAKLMRSTGPKQAPEHFNGRMLSHEAALGPFTTAACWHDLLGFSAKLEEAGWTLEGPSATLLVKRLHNLYVSLTQFGSPHEQLALNGYALKAGQLTYDCRYSTMHGMPVTGGRGFRGLKPFWYNGVPP